VISILSTTHKDLRFLAQCHIVSFPKSLSSTLGLRYLEGMLSWYLSTTKTFLFHIQDEEGKCIGYCGGIISDGSFATGSASGMAQHTFSTAIIAFITHPWAIFHHEFQAKWPLLWKNICIKIGIRSRYIFTSFQKQSMANDPHVGLVVIGVNPLFHGHGYGSALLQEFDRRSVEVYGIHKLQLTVLVENLNAIRAYERNGWIKGDLKGRSLSMWKHLSV
jgi:GNAT superfamily N-acetyltransferase